MINQQNMKVKNGSTWHTICPFPVGFIYLAATSTSPGTTFGGTWAALSSGYFLRPAGTFSGTGGESSHTLTVNEIPSHTHNYNMKQSNQEAAGFGLAKPNQGFTDRPIINNSGVMTNSPALISFTGGGQLTTICRLIKMCLDGDEPHRELVV